jgi:chromosome transmission fidelity protein 1
VHVGLHSDSGSDDEGEAEVAPKVTKILFCSRTHSQLSQFMHELRASPFGKDARAVVLGSRQTMCVNDAVLESSRGSLARINDKCKDLQQKKSTDKAKKGCPYLDVKKVQSFAESALAYVQDVEDLKRRGSQTTSCPYYGTRAAVAAAEVVAMPYNLLLHKSTREAVR